MQNKLEELDKEWNIALMRNVRIQTSIIYLIDQRVNLLQTLSHRTLNEIQL